MPHGNQAKPFVAIEAILKDFRARTDGHALCHCLGELLEAYKDYCGQVQFHHHVFLLFFLFFRNFYALFPVLVTHSHAAICIVRALRWALFTFLFYRLNAMSFFHNVY